MRIKALQLTAQPNLPDAAAGASGIDEFVKPPSKLLIP
jgi:hypothetical protein